jgi:hypothetical protein
LKNTPTNFSHKFKALQLTFQVVIEAKKSLTKSVGRRTLLEYTGSYSRVYLVLGPGTTCRAVSRQGRTMLASAWMRRCFFVASFERTGRDLARYEQSIGKKRGLAIKHSRAQSPAHLITRGNPHGVYKPTKNSLLGQSLFPAARRPWTSSVAQSWSADAFFI